MVDCRKVIIAVILKNVTPNDVRQSIIALLDRKAIIRTTVTLPDSNLRLLQTVRPRDLQNIQHLLVNGVMDDILEDSCK